MDWTTTAIIAACILIVLWRVVRATAADAQRESRRQRVRTLCAKWYAAESALYKYQTENLFSGSDFDVQKYLDLAKERDQAYNAYVSALSSR